MEESKFPCTYQFFKNYYRIYKPLEDKYYGRIDLSSPGSVKKAFNLTKYITQALRSSFYFDTLEFNDKDTIESMRRCDIFNMFKKEQ
jgi:hypothetical protein